MRLLVGLGNPGPQYLKTRHNLGFVTIDCVAEALNLKKWKSFKDGDLAEQGSGKEKNLIFKPLQFMNTSGVFIRQVADYYDIPSEDICIVADDVYIAPGIARVRKSGGDGGHNGWKSVIDHLDPDTFWRVKIGAGLYEQHPDKRAHQSALDTYVLQPLPHHDEKIVYQLIDRVVPNLVEWLERGSLTQETIRLA